MIKIYVSMLSYYRVNFSSASPSLMDTIQSKLHAIWFPNTPEDIVTDLQSWQLDKFAFSSSKEKLVRLLHSSFTSFLGTRCPRQNLALIFFSGFELSVRSTATSLWAGFPLWRTDKSISKEDLKANFFSGTPDKNMTETQIYTGKQILNYAFFKIEVSENSSLPF